MTDAPVQATATVLTVRRVAGYHAMTLVAPAVAERFRPGQLVALAVGGPHTSLLRRRCFSVYEVKPDYGGTVEFVFAERDAGTRWLAGLRSRDSIDLAGPLGHPFPLPRDPVSCVLVGSAHAAAALFPLADALRRRRCAVHFVLGASTVGDVFGARSARRVGDSATIAAEDGSADVAGTVTDVLPQAIDQVSGDVVYACAPMPTLRSVTAIAERYGIPTQVSAEAYLQETAVCGTGLCLACVLPVVGDDGVTRMARACVDGPVLRGERVRWDDVGSVPFDALGAPRAVSAARRAGRAASGHLHEAPL
ncbi:MAG TPA: dihydroorotate dehydrogenase electron transfer subunit [Streptosporangiaceae bacterium]